MAYVISGHSDARTSGLDSTRYDTSDEAKGAVESVMPDSVFFEPVEDGWLVYSCEDDAAADSDGASACAAIALDKNSAG
jgi:hypothetical protein